PFAALTSNNSLNSAGALSAETGIVRKSAKAVFAAIRQRNNNPKKDLVPLFFFIPYLQLRHLLISSGRSKISVVSVERLRITESRLARATHRPRQGLHSTPRPD